MKASSTTESRDWRLYCRKGDVAARNRLVEHHLGLVHHFAHRMSVRVGGSLDQEELTSAGVLGLLDAVAAFDPERGYRFSTFAAARIRGAMLDELRLRDEAPRSVRRRQRAVETAHARLSASLDRSPRHPEVANVLGVDAKTLWRWESDIARSRRIPLQTLAGKAAHGEPTPEWAESGDRVLHRLESERRTHRLLQELATLPERDALVVRLYDLESCTLREIAARLGVTESRVSQIRSRALQCLRSRLSDLEERIAA